MFHSFKASKLVFILDVFLCERSTKLQHREPKNTVGIFCPMLQLFECFNTKIICLFCPLRWNYQGPQLSSLLNACWMDVKAIRAIVYKKNFLPCIDICFLSKKYFFCKETGLHQIHLVPIEIDHNQTHCRKPTCKKIVFF